MILNKPYTNKQYADMAIFCNKNGMMIADKGEYLESVLPPEPSKEEKQNSVRAVRNSYLAATDIYMLIDFPISADEREEYKDYRQYLRDYTNHENWWELLPLTFEEWKETPVDEPEVEETQDEPDVL